MGSGSALLRGTGSDPALLCRCDPGFYDHRGGPGSNMSQQLEVAAGADCRPCMVGMNCSAGAITLRSLPLLVGYYQPSAASIDVRLCPDAHSNCISSLDWTDQCSDSSSGCRGGVQTYDGGGVDEGSTCAPTLSGVFCLLCANRSDHFYVQGGSHAVAHCEPCGNAFQQADRWVFSGALALLLLLVTLCQFLHVTKCARTGYRAKLSPWVQTARAAATNLERLLGTKIKLLIGFFQIATQMDDVYDIQLPPQLVVLFRSIRPVLTLSLDTIPMVCVGAEGYYRVLLFWIGLPVGLICLVVLSIAILRRLRRQPLTVSDVFLQAAPASLRLLFVMYPIVSTAAHKSFACYSFENGAGYLVADVSIICGSPEHDAVRQLAWVAIALYPIGNLLLVSGLLWCARAAICSRQPTKLSAAISWLWEEYTPEAFFWEPMEMGRRFILVGIFVVAPYDRGSVMQLILATTFCLVYLTLQLQASPYRRLPDNYVALGCSFCLVAFFLAATLYKYLVLLQLRQIQTAMSIELIFQYAMSPTLLTQVLLSCCLGCIAVSAAILIVQMSHDRIVQLREQRASRARRLKFKASSAEVNGSRLPPGHFHAFLSHGSCLVCTSSRGV